MTRVRRTLVGGCTPLALVELSGLLSRDETMDLLALFDQALRELAIPCACGHPFASHDQRSPHPCACGACLVFVAAAPEPPHANGEPRP